MNRIFKIKSIQIFSAILLFSFAFVKSQNSVVLDVSKTYKEESIAGFLHLNNIETLDNDIKALKPKFWRFGNYMFKSQERKDIISGLISRKIQPILIMSDLCIYKTLNENSTDGNRILPYSDPKSYEAFVRKMYAENGNTVIYDIWNEPDTGFWSGTKEQFFLAFKKAHDIIRSMPGGKDAVIMGPSCSRFYKEFIEDFLTFCEKNNVVVDILAWHEGGVISDIKEMKANINFAKEVWLNQFKKLKIKEIYIPEIIGESVQFSPLAVLSFLNTFEEGGVSGACKTCHDNPAEIGGNSCFNNSMDGLLMPNGKPRSVWFAYKLYAESLDDRFKLITKNENFSVIGYYLNKNKSVNILIGNTSGSNKDLNISLKNIDVKKYFSGKRKLHYNLYFVEDTKEKELKSPQLKQSEFVSIKNGIININLKNIESNGILVLELK